MTFFLILGGVASVGLALYLLVVLLLPERLQ